VLQHQFGTSHSTDRRWRMQQPGLFARSTPGNEQEVTTMIEIIRLPEVIRQTGKSRSTIYSDMTAGTFPPQVRIGIRSVGWVQERIQRHLEQKVKESDNPVKVRPIQR
jgi:prophage regulatory protein